MKLTYCLAWLLIASFCIGCGRSNSTTVTGPHGEKVTVTKKGQQMNMTVKGEKGEQATITNAGDNQDITIKGKDGQKTHFSSSKTGVALPDGFPKDVAVYPKATINMATTVEKTISLMLKTSDSKQDVLAFYKKQFQENDWKIKNTMDSDDQSMINGEKEHRTLTVLIHPESDATIVNLVVAEER
jgi:hypothetical protein